MRLLFPCQQPKTQFIGSFIAISDGTLEVELCVRGGGFGVKFVALGPKWRDEGELILRSVNIPPRQIRITNLTQKKRIKPKVRFYVQHIHSDDYDDNDSMYLRMLLTLARNPFH